MLWNHDPFRSLNLYVQVFLNQDDRDCRFSPGTRVKKYLGGNHACAGGRGFHCEASDLEWERGYDFENPSAAGAL